MLELDRLASERYGTYREVPLLELLDEDIGLGPPATYEYPPSIRNRAENSSERSNKSRESFLMQLLNDAMKNQTNEIELSTEMIQKLRNDNVDNTQVPLSLDLYLSIHSNSPQDVNNGNFNLVIGAYPASSRAGQTFGRFIDVMGEDITSKLKEINQKETQVRPEVIFAEIAYLPNTGRATNVVLTESIRSHEISLGTNSKTEAKS